MMARVRRAEVVVSEAALRGQLRDRLGSEGCDHRHPVLGGFENVRWVGPGWSVLVGDCLACRDAVQLEIA